MRGIVGTLVALAVLGGASRAEGQIPVWPSPESETASVQAPRLVAAVEAVYPEAAMAAGVEGTVVLRLTIDPEGNVTEAEVLEALGHGLDEAARDAALRFKFEPARRDGRAVASRILYAYELALPGRQTPLPEGASTPPQRTPVASVPTQATAPAQPAPVEISVRGTQSEAQRLQHSADAVNVVDMRKARQRNADLGDALARQAGVTFRRSGGLGSDARFCLNGVCDGGIRLFVDGVPLELAGYPAGGALGLSITPVNFVERVEIYRGVVPIRFGADALGGAVNIVTDQSYQTRAGLSYQVGSFGTHRTTVDARYRHDPSGFVAIGTALLDRAANDYEVDVEVTDERGRLSPATVRRFHDGFLAYGGALELGVVDRPWAKRLLVRGFASTYDKDLQHNLVMKVPYGEVTYGETIYGASARYEGEIHRDVELQLLTNYSRRASDFVDRSRWVYNWFGQRVLERRVPGEISSEATDQTTWQHSAFGRAHLQWKALSAHTFRASSTLRFTGRSGEDRTRTDSAARDPLSAERDLITVVSGVEYESNWWDERLSNVAFAKDYFHGAQSEEALPGGVVRERDRTTHTQGVGDSLRFRFTPWLLAKASYEYSTRLPEPWEVFGDGVLVHASLELEPEVSHNANFGPRLELNRSPIGKVVLDVNAFYRDSDKMIVLLGNDRFFSNQNVYRSRSIGFENAAEWVSPGRWVSVDGTITWQDVRNASSQGAFGAFEGDRIPNRPHLIASWGLSLRFAGLPGADDAVEPFYQGRFVDSFFRGWESQGLREFKQVVDAQLTHNAGVTYRISRPGPSASLTLEASNVTDAKVFDNFGVQKPGRAYFAKVVGEL